MDILIWDESWTFVDIVDVFESFIWTDRYVELGDFELYSKVDLEWISKLSVDRFVTIPNSEHAMIIEKVNIITDVEDGNKMLVVGRSLESILDRRVIWGQKTVDGNFQDKIKELIDESIINPSISARQIPNFIFEMSTDPRITSLTLEAQYFGDNLLDAVTNACNSKDIGFKVTRSETEYIFKLYAGEDRSYDQSANPFVIFSPDFDNLLDSNYIKSNQDLKSVAFMAGEGEGSNRKTTSIDIGGETSAIGRREVFVDCSTISQTIDGGTIPDAEYITQMQQKGKEELEKTKIIEAFDGEIAQTEQHTYGEDYQMGDIIQIENEYGMSTKSRVIEMIYSEDEEGTNSYPTFKSIE